MDLPSPSNPGVGCSQYCAALNSEITDSDCRALRGSNLPCPADCPRYPFGRRAYETFLDLEAVWTPKAAEQVFRSLGRDRFDQLMGEGALLTDDDPAALESGLIHALHYGLAFERHPAGGPLSEHWAESGYPKLDNDERIMARFRQSSFVTVVQIIKTLDHQTLSCLDALAPDSPPFLLFDRATAAHASAGVRLLSWLTHYPHFSRLGGMAREIPDPLWDPWRHAIEELFEKDRAREPKLTLRSWLSRRAGACADLIDTLSAEPREALSPSDFHHRVLAYPLQAPAAQLLALLGSQPDFFPLTPPAPHPDSGFLARFSWTVRPHDTPKARLFHHDGPENGIGASAILHVFEDRLIQETFTQAKFTFANRVIPELLAGLIAAPESITVDGFAGSWRGARPDPADVAGHPACATSAVSRADRPGRNTPPA